MTSLPKRRCSHIGCREYTPCLIHVRPNPRQRGYDRDWEKKVARAKVNQPTCTNCGTRGTKANPLTGDHPIPLALGGRTDQDPGILCRRCNSSKGARRDG